MKCPRCGEGIAEDADSCAACGELVRPAMCAEHPDRKAEGRCVVCGRAVCSECDAEKDATHLCAAHADVPVIAGWAEVYSTGNDIEAQLIRENLEAEGIDSRVLSQKDHFTFTVDLGDLSPVRVLVPAFEYGDARRLISEHMNARGELAFACPTCGEAYDPGEKRCANCGSELK